MRSLYYATCRKYFFNKSLGRQEQITKYKAIKDFIETNFPDNSDEYEKILSDAEEKALSDFEYYLWCTQLNIDRQKPVKAG